MQVRYVSRFDLDAAVEPGAPVWKGVSAVAMPMIGTPVALQPSATIRAVWLKRKIGATEGVEVAAVHDGETIGFRLEWKDASENREIADTTAFPDAAGVLFPSAMGSIASTMGAPGLAVNAWYWQADEDGRGRQVVAEGLGTTRTVDLESVRGRGVWKEGRWRVVISRSLRMETSEPVVQLEPGQISGFAVAVWEGSCGERAGIKAYSGEWTQLRLDGVPTARR